MSKLIVFEKTGLFSNLKYTLLLSVNFEVRFAIFKHWRFRWTWLLNQKLYFTVHLWRKYQFWNASYLFLSAILLQHSKWFWVANRVQQRTSWAIEENLTHKMGMTIQFRSAVSVGGRGRKILPSGKHIIYSTLLWE